MNDAATILAPERSRGNPDDRLNDEKLSTLTDDELCKAFDRYQLEKALSTGHYMISLLDNHPRTRHLLGALSAEHK